MHGKIAILGSAPSSLGLAPFGDPTWDIWACSPGTYPHLSRCDAFFELHRWEPGVVGKAHTQVPWFSPEYVAWMGSLTCPVWMQSPVAEIPTSRALPVDELTSKYGDYFFTSSVAWMMACAIEDIIEWREANGLDTGGQIGLFGVDMAANEEYGDQRAGCHFFCQLAATLGIQIVVPPESDLLRPRLLYGIHESSHFTIKLTVRRRELEGRLAQARQAKESAIAQELQLLGALDDLNYIFQTWNGDRPGRAVSPDILVKSPILREAFMPAVQAEEETRI